MDTSDKDRLEILAKIKVLQSNILKLDKESSVSSSNSLKNAEKTKKIKQEIVTSARELKKINEDLVTLTKNYLNHQIEQEDRISSIADQQFFIKDIEKQRLGHYNSINTKLTDNLVKYNEMADINIKIASLSSDELSKQELLNIEYQSIANSLDARGSKLAEQLAILDKQNIAATSYAKLSDDQKEILEGQRQVLLGINKTIQGVIETTYSLFSGWKGFVGGTLMGAGFALDKLGKTTREMGGWIGSAGVATTALSFAFEDADGVAKSLAKEFGGLSHVSWETQLNTNLMAANMGIGAEAAAELTGNFAHLNGGSHETAQNLAESAKTLAKSKGLIPAQIMADLAGSTKEFAEYGKRGGINMAEAAVAAGQLGVNMAAMTAVTDSLLDFETSMTAELELSAMLGKTINLSKARQLAYDGNIRDSVKESLHQMGGIDAFNRMDIFQKRQAAEAIGLSVEQLQQMASHLNELNADGTMQLDTFGKWEQALTMFTTTGLGKATGALGGMLTMSGQIGRGFSAWGIDTGKVVKDTLQVGKNLLGMLPGMSKLGKGMGSVGESIGGTGVGKVLKTFKDKALEGVGAQKESLIEKAKAVAVDKGKDIVESTTDTAKEKFQESIGNKADDIKDKVLGGGTDGEKALGKGSITDKLGKINMTAVLKGAAALVIVAGAVWVFGKAVQEFMKVSWESVGMAVVSMLALVGAVALLGTLMSSGVGAVAILAGAAAMVVVAGSMYILGKAIQEMAIGFTAMDKIGSTITSLVGQIGGITSLSVAFMGLAGSIGALGIASLLAMPALMGLGIAGTGIAVVSNLFNPNEKSDETTSNTSLNTESISTYERDMVQLTKDLIAAVKENRDVYLDKEKVTSIVKKTGDKHTSNSSFGLAGA